MSSGYIYVLQNDAFPDLKKIGKTTRHPDERAAELSQSTGVPCKFRVVFKYFVSDCHRAERRVHEELTRCRFNDDREFFRITRVDAVRIICRVCEDYLPALVADDDGELPVLVAKGTSFRDIVSFIARLVAIAFILAACVLLPAIASALIHPFMGLILAFGSFWTWAKLGPKPNGGTVPGTVCLLGYAAILAGFSVCFARAIVW